MNIAEYSISHRVISWMFVIILLVGGCLSFFGLGQLEFPEFTIKQAMVITQYPGATPQQVEEEVTLSLEEAIQELEYVKHIRSISSSGSSQITVDMKDQYHKGDLPQIWDELRRKVNDTQKDLPPGVYPSLVKDDYSDVFGMLFNIRGEGYSHRDLENYADFLKRELVLIPGVKKVAIAGERQEQIVLEVSREKMAALGVDPNWLFSLIQNQNVVSNAGRIFVEGRSIRIHPTGEFNNVNELKQLIVSTPGSSQLVRLGDIATVHKDYEETPSTIYHSNGFPALSLGISFTSGVNVVDVGGLVRERLNELEGQRPIGIDLDTVYDQPEVVLESVNGFLINLAQSVAIVIIVLLCAMGVRSGLLMGVVLLLTILGTFIVMRVVGIELQLISLGALIIALGMLVDNAIVVTEGIQVGLQRGLTRIEAAKRVVKQTQWPLLGATVIAVIAFAPVGLSDEMSGEFCVSLFQVLLISLMLSWVTAITLVPFFSYLLFKEEKLTEQAKDFDPYQGALFTIYKQLLSFALKHRPVTLIITVIALFSAFVGFGYVKNVFFPPSNTPIFFVDYWMPEGSDIRDTETEISRFEQQVLALDGVNNVTTVIGMGAQRFVLPYTPEKQYSSYGQLVVETKDLDSILGVISKVQGILDQQFADVEYRVKRLQNGPSPSAEIEARFYGEDPVVLRSLAVQAMQVLRDEPLATNIRHGWRNRTPIIRPQLDEASARRSGISKQALDEALLINFSGKQVGVYREGTHLLPMIIRAPEAERLNADSLTDLQVWSADHKNFVPITQAVSSFDTEWEDPLIIRRERKRMLSVMADPQLLSDETTDSVFRKVRAKIEAIPLPDGYKLEWGGSYETSRDAQEAVFASIPMGYLFMFLITVLLFNTVRQPLAIWSTVPLALIGVVAGLLLLDAPFSFMALLGLLSLSGMLIKNGIVLVEQIKLELDQGREEHEAIFHASVSRVRPVCMAALTTMLGMIPLLFDAFFESMAVTIIFGLGFATVLTLIVLPVVYSLLYKISFKQFHYSNI
ncbi:efflux RND transporter permease subunit [Endozoicomonas sp. Mp262]|uniref:efflux RND transporter permease subunit n=1 Tax=Endozoicomonas sp. Mp262 TaxID=2919499 RepID=UPI0021DA025B